ncbi:MAG TPA: MFS transporter [Burkholderiaceae bacterium]|nr:MFS transporter [Burkholderiaceae bacterium]
MIAAPPVRRPILALAATLSVQAGATLALTAPSVMAPAVAPELGLPPQRIGWFVGLAYLSAMFSGLVAGRRLGTGVAIPMSRAAVLACIAGLLLAAAAGTASPWLLLPAAVAIGTGYGLPNPAASVVLAVHAPAHRRGLFFSIKQTGVPVGVGLAGVLVPPLLAALGWRWTLVALAAGCALLWLALAGARVLDDAGPRAAPPAGDGPRAGVAAVVAETLAPLAEVWRTPALRRLGIASFAYSATQLCFVTFLVSRLALEQGMGLAAAAGLLAVSQATSVGCRVLWGQVADRFLSPLRLLALLGLAMSVSVLALGMLPAGGSAGATLAVVLACAASAMSWNGVFYAELARRIEPARLGTVTGGTQFLTFCGAMAGPVAFSLLVAPLGSHGAVYALIAAVPLAVGLRLAAAWRD